MFASGLALIAAAMATAMLYWERDRLVAALSVGFGMLEAFGVGLAGTVVAIAFTLWALWALVSGIQVLRGGRRVQTATRPA